MHARMHVHVEVQRANRYYRHLRKYEMQGGWTSSVLPSMALCSIKWAPLGGPLNRETMTALCGTYYIAGYNTYIQGTERYNEWNPTIGCIYTEKVHVWTQTCALSLRKVHALRTRVQSAQRCAPLTTEKNRKLVPSEHTLGGVRRGRTHIHEEGKERKMQFLSTAL